MVVLVIKNFIYQTLYKIATVLKPVLIKILPKGVRQQVKNKLLHLATSNMNKSYNNLEDQHCHGINLVGYSRAEMGIGESCRIAARSIDAADIPFGIINFKGTSSARMSDLSWAHKEMGTSQYDINLIHVNAEQMKDIYTYFGSGLFQNRYNIGVWHWELPDFPDEWLDSFNLVDEIWAPSTFIADAISLKSPVPVIKIPHSIEVNVLEPRSRAYYNLPSESFLFLTMYDINSFEERKNPRASLEAFKRAFEPNDVHVGLVVKVNGLHGKPKEMEQLNELLSNYTNIYFVKETLSRNDTNALIASCDCFISLHRSEGFGLGLAEAMYLGKPAIGTNWSSTTDFMKNNNSCLVDYELVNVMNDFGPYKAYQKWANPDIEHASFYMKKLVEDQEYYCSIANKGKKYIREHYSPKVVGEMMKKRISYINLGVHGG
ncbi:glycosyltransferase family 4 protein [Paenibacillus popilliae]|uniref:Glycosyltransferase n=1 Tax=Paenibacillus popilliae ATCC 14706 TaxID=1212764 RepID=M9LZ86_PAEPP|nr:glycosyltransferase family 4 protein [Paenibacillus popilliae]GAC41584.1 glycosyltransferase [Paenibacillus popilliae ATCC 14706]